MTETQYFWGWVVYSAGAIGCLLSLWLVVRKWRARVKRPLMMACAVLFFMPDTINPEHSFLGPAFLISFYDGLSQGFDALWRNGQGVVIATVIATIVGLIMPVSQSKATSDDENEAPQKNKHQWQEPVCQ